VTGADHRQSLTVTFCFSDRSSTNPFIPALKINQNMRGNPESSACPPTLAGLPVRHSLSAADVPSVALWLEKVFFARSKPNPQPYLTHIK